MIARAIHRILALLLLLFLQEPAMLVQEVAWVRMIFTYSQENGLARGITETFSGNRPCALCHHAAEMRKDSQNDKARTETEIPRFNMVAQRVVAIPRYQADPDPASFNRWTRAHDIHGSGRRDAPPVPPPELS